MTITMSTFQRLVRARQALVIAGRALDAAEDACACEGRRCVPGCPVPAAEDTYDRALLHRAECETSYRECLTAFG